MQEHNNNELNDQQN